jgi:hypothetical protein
MHERFKLRVVYFYKMIFVILQVVVENLLKTKNHLQASCNVRTGIYRASGYREQRQEVATAIAKIIGYRQQTTIHMYRERMMNDMNKVAASVIAKATGKL